MKLYLDYKNIWECNNPSGKLKNIKKIIKQYVSNITYDKVGNMYIGDFTQSKPCLVAHLDSVHSHVGKIKVQDDCISSKNGIGGDDKCGIIACLEIRKYCDVNVLFTVDEEIGGIGASHCDFDKLKNVMYFIEIDRKGSSDLITDLLFSKSVTKEFMSEISDFMKEFQFKETSGLYTDLCDILPVMGVCGINLSAGYYNPHTKKEYVILSELQNTINFVITICSTVRERFELPEQKLFEYEDKDTYYPEEWFLNDLSCIDSIEELMDYVYSVHPEDKKVLGLLEKAYQLGLEEKEMYVGLDF